MSALNDRLARLRVEAGAGALATPAPLLCATTPTPRPRDTLRALLHAREQRRAAPRPVLAAPAGVEVAAGVYLVERTFAYAANPRLMLPWLAQAPIERSRLVCFDTETTGLAGGVGTRAFMIGVARWRADRLTVRQLYLTTMAGEAAMLRLFNAWLDPAAILVSYNGKSYDAPLLKGRLRLNHVDHRLAELPHLDWLHPVRRRYRGVFENCRLATIERQALRIVRDDDLPGAQAPAAWLAFLRGESSRNLARVLDHNRQDVVTLMRLSDHMTASDPAAP